MIELFQASPLAAIIFVFTIITSIYAFNDPTLHGKFMLHPYSVAKGQKVHTLITSGLIHADWMHLIFNMMTFYFFAFRLESMIGHWQFGALYLVSLILSDLPTVFKHKEHFWYNSLGASGAISAVLFSYILFDPMAKMGILFIPIPIPAIIFGVLYLVYCMYAARNAKDHINHDAHFFGALSGMLITVILVPGIVQHFMSMLGW
ncbi:MAG: rhomboid family intramembrane serine protease [Pedobacter sp.]|nr:MAG: rhomboid family intramembrane serine protease [Pedobacter sp.]